MKRNKPPKLVLGPLTRKQKFLEDIIKVYQKHKLSLSHEDLYGAFIVMEYYEPNIEWLQNALIKIK